MLYARSRWRILQIDRFDELAVAWDDFCRNHRARIYRWGFLATAAERFAALRS